MHPQVLLDVKTASSKILQTLSPPLRLNIDYTCEHTKTDESKWAYMGNFRLLFERETGNFNVVGYTSPSQEVNSIFLRKYYKNGVLTSINTGRLGRWYASVKRESSESRFLLLGTQANNYWERYFDILDLIAEDGILNGTLKTGIFEKNKKKYLKLENQIPENEEGSFLKFSFSFDIQTGLLHEAETCSFDLQKGGEEGTERHVTTWVISEYAESNGFFFPAEIKIKRNNGSILRLKVDKNTLKINPPAKEGDFDAVFPSACHVKDKINNTSYVLPAIGNNEAEEKIVKELDALFEKTKK